MIRDEQPIARYHRQDVWSAAYPRTNPRCLAWREAVPNRLFSSSDKTRRHGWILGGNQSRCGEDDQGARGQGADSIDLSDCKQKTGASHSARASRQAGKQASDSRHTVPPPLCHLCFLLLFGCPQGRGWPPPPPLLPPPPPPPPPHPSSHCGEEERKRRPTRQASSTLSPPIIMAATPSQPEKVLSALILLAAAAATLVALHRHRPGRRRRPRSTPTRGAFR